MKKQILMLIIGALIGAIITTGVFLLLKENSKQNLHRGVEMKERPSMNEEAIDGPKGRFERNTDKQQKQDNNTATNTNGV